MRQFVLLLMLTVPGVARGDDLGAAVRARNWRVAERLAAEAADPVAARVVRYLRALTPGAADGGEILAVLESEPGWPQAGGLSRRYADALVRERDDRVVEGLCRKRAPETTPALLRCAGVVIGGEAMARRAWLTGITDAADETAFMKRWGGAIGPADQTVRFDRLAWAENGAPGGVLARQAVRIEPGMRAAAETLLALKRGDPAGADLFAALPTAAQGLPVIVLELLRWLRRADRDVEAARVWGERGAAAETAAPTERRALFWSERNVLARKLLRAREDAAAFGVVAGAPAPNGDALFLSGWIALRRLGQPRVAAVQFHALAAASKAAITQGRASYWLGRALAEAGEGEGALASYRQGARWLTTYYGQLSALAAGDGMATVEGAIRALRDPVWDETRALAFAETDIARAATLMAAWGLRWRAKPFLAAMETQEDDPAGRSIVGRFASALGMPEQAVASARLAGRDGTMLPVVGWPAEVEVPPGPVDRAVALGVIRQESSFDPLATSPVGAVGLMQLMPGTAAQVSKGLGAVGALTDVAFNVRLGTAYLAAQMERFGALPPALAAYNAGPNRVRDWMESIGDPVGGGVDAIDWVELIPFDETRNYVQRIVESVLIYRAEDGVVLAHPVLAWGGSGL